MNASPKTWFVDELDLSCESVCWAATETHLRQAVNREPVYDRLPDSPFAGFNALKSTVSISGNYQNSSFNAN